jgi:hypothetical protein
MASFTPVRSAWPLESTVHSPSLLVRCPNIPAAEFQRKGRRQTREEQIYGVFGDEEEEYHRKAEPVRSYAMAAPMAFRKAGVMGGDAPPAAAAPPPAKKPKVAAASSSMPLLTFFFS